MPRKGSNKGNGMQEEARINQGQGSGRMQSGMGDGMENTINAGGGNGFGSDDSARQIFSSDEIAERAYQIFEREGRMDGRDMDHWLQAERELRTEREKRSTGMTAENAPRSARQHQRSQ